MFYLIEERDGDVTTISENENLHVLVGDALDNAEDDGYIPSVESRGELEDRLLKDRMYTDGDAAVWIVERP